MANDASTSREENERAREATAGLVPMSATDLAVADANDDVRGWSVRDRDGQAIGRVLDLLVDPKAMKVRYLDVALDPNVFRAERRALIPVGATRSDDDDRVVRTDLSVEALGAYPEYQGTGVTRDYERSLRSALGDDARTPASDADFYADARYDDSGLRGRGRPREATAPSSPPATPLTDDREQRLTLAEERLAVDTRLVSAGEAFLRKRVETEHVRQSVPVRHEELVVERRPLAPGASAEMQVTDDEIRIPLMREELVVEKRLVPVEEIVIRRKVVTENRTVEADLRREYLDDSDLKGR
ncbi:MAG TPA: DUF2382 domain-containing protein [Gemmatimonadaceae bacterium]|nr:DUF2382 domain-containing protein [Gemmatimonadaceae bacterium]